MNSKIIAIIAVVAMCGAALVGVGFAYTATVENGGNSVSTDAQFVKMDLNGDASDNKIEFKDIIVDYAYDSATKTYKPTFDTIDTQMVKMNVDYDGAVDGEPLYLYIKETNVTGSLGTGIGLKVTAYKATVGESGVWTKGVKVGTEIVPDTEYKAINIASGDRTNNLILEFELTTNSSAVSTAPVDSDLSFGLKFVLSSSNTAPIA